MVDYYRILEVQRTATSGDIKKAYRKLALRWHPDKNPENLDEANKRFKEISEAYEVLIDEKKRRVYDQYGKEGLQMPGSKRRHEDDFDPHFVNSFVFRDPEEVFREFFGGTPFEDLFSGIHGSSRLYGFNRHNHSANNSLSASLFDPLASLGSLGSLGLSFGSPFENFLDGSAGNFTSFGTFTSFDGASGGGGGGGGGVAAAVKRTSTSTRFINGKKITTKKVYENGKETIMSYENDVLKSKTVNGVPQAITFDEASTSRQGGESVDAVASVGQTAKPVHADSVKGSRIKTHHHPHVSKKHDKSKRK